MFAEVNTQTVDQWLQGYFLRGADISTFSVPSCPQSMVAPDITCDDVL